MYRIEEDGSMTMFSTTTPPSSLLGHPVSSSSTFMIQVDCNSPVNPYSLKAGRWDKGKRQATFPTSGDLQKNLNNTFIYVSLNWTLQNGYKEGCGAGFFFFYIGLGL